MTLQREIEENAVPVPPTPEPTPEEISEDIKSQKPPRRILLPDAPVIQLVSGQREEPRQKPPPRKPTPWEQAVGDATDSFERQAATLGSQVTWTLERVGPNFHKGQQVPCGIFPEEYTGPATSTVIGGIGGGGTYYVSFSDPATGKPRRLGPIKIAGSPRMDIGLQMQDDANGDGGYVYPMGFEAGAPNAPREKDDAWVLAHDPMLGVVKRRMSDLERDNRSRTADPAVLELSKRLDAQAESMKALAESMTRSIAEMSKTMLAAAAPKEDPSAKWLEIERARIAAEKDAKSEELRYLREKADKELALAHAKIEAERDLAEKKLEAERDKHEREKEEIRARLDAEKERIESERKLAEDRAIRASEVADKKLESSQELLMGILKDRVDPMRQMGETLGLFRELQDALGGESVEPEEGKPRSNKEKALEALMTGIQRMYITAEPALKQYFVNLAAQTKQQIMAKDSPPQIQQKQPVQQQREEHKTEEVAAPQPTIVNTTDMVAKMLAEVSSSIDRNVAPSVVWHNLIGAMPELALQLKAYATPEEMASEIQKLGSMPGFEKHVKKFADLAIKLTGSGKRWAEQFIAVAQKAEIPLS